ncbi:hypothetical protein PIROE2DRAFT_17098 [Piromyces sp. E2]|nr:hypothetical protein PIROE2DRAFT_17098 [Piromyces sp. E2]|eukprot:OUM57799.1 hypothetical protein PIROE2DRAFT_17098 [Piromyces sp. E2]
MFYYKHYIDKIVNRIQKKYDQRNVIEKLKSDLEEENELRNSNKSLETIVSQKKIKKKEKCFNSYKDASILCKFIMYNRSLSSFSVVERIFKECVYEFPRNPYSYIDFWNHLYGIRLFISKNNMYYEDYFTLLEKMNKLSDLILLKVSNLDNNLIVKFFIYYASFSNNMNVDKFSKKNDNNPNHSNSNIDFGFGIDMVKNMAIEYHVKSLTTLKNLFNELKDLNTTNNLNNILLLNDDLSEIVQKTKQYYITYVNKFSFSKESVELYTSFIRDVMNEPDVAVNFFSLFVF